MGLFFTSDLHFGHANIIRYSNRPFENLDEMHRELIRRWNSVVSTGDIVYVLGDFALCSSGGAIGFAHALSGQKFLVCGNHDKGNRKHYEKSGVFAWIGDYREVTEAGQKMVLSHYPFLTWNGSGRGSWMLHGHCHGNLPEMEGLRLDVGVDCHEYTPLSLDSVGRILSKKRVSVVDHHGREEM